MGTIKKLIEIDDEDILNLKDCLDRTKGTLEIGVDLWPFTIKHIIKEWEEDEKWIGGDPEEEIINVDETKEPKKSDYLIKDKKKSL